MVWKEQRFENLVQRVLKRTLCEGAPDRSWAWCFTQEEKIS